MMPELAPAQLKQVKVWEYAVRFAFGGVITVITGLIAAKWGPAIAGLFLAFPAILPASITLVKHHDGRGDAVDDARGARLGSAGLIAFAAVVAVTATRWPPALVLIGALVAWAAVDVGLWFVRFARER